MTVFPTAPGAPAEGMDPTQTNVGPMAENFDSATGGDGTATTINPMITLGLTMSAMKALDKRVRGLEQR